MIIEKNKKHTHICHYCKKKKNQLLLFKKKKKRVYYSNFLYYIKTNTGLFVNIFAMIIDKNKK